MKFFNFFGLLVITALITSCSANYLPNRQDSQDVCGRTFIASTSHKELSIKHFKQQFCEWNVTAANKGMTINLQLINMEEYFIEVTDIENEEVLFSSNYSDFEVNISSISSSIKIYMISKYNPTTNLSESNSSIIFFASHICGQTKSIEKVETFTFNKVFLNNCWWTVYTKPNNKLKAIISNLNERQSIEIYFATSQSFSSRSNLIAAVPTSTDTFELMSPLNYFTFRFNSSQVEKDQLLNVTIAVKESPLEEEFETDNEAIENITPSCGVQKLQAFPGEDKSLTSPQFPLNYQPNLNCWWIIEAPFGSYVKITFNHFNTEACCDSLSLYNAGDIKEAALTHRFVEMKGEQSKKDKKSKLTNQEITSATSYLAMNFLTDDKNEFEGFNISYKAVGVQTGCENNHRYVKINQSVEITSPNYPLNYNPSENCWWIIASPPNTRIALIFNYFSTENCCDFLKIYDSPSPQSSNFLNIIRTNKGTSYETYTYSSYNYLSLHFISDLDLQEGGFDITVTAIEANNQNPVEEYTNQVTPTIDQCGKTDLIATNTTSTLLSPGYPNDYMPNLNCWWTISTSEDRRVLLTIQSFLTEECCDKLKIFNGAVVDNQEEARVEVSGAINTTQFLSKSHYIRLNFNSDFEWQDSGFTILYKSVEKPADDLVTITETDDLLTITEEYVDEVLCGRSDLVALEGLIGTILSPGYPFGLRDGFECWWILRSISTFHILITIEDFESQEDNLEIYDADSIENSIESNLIIRLNEDNVLPGLRLLTHGTFVTLHFKSGRSNGRNAFNISYTASDIPDDKDSIQPSIPSSTSVRTTEEAVTSPSPICGGNFVGSEEEVLISSPNFPNMYPANVDCDWIITSPPGGRIQLTISDVDVERCCDYVQPFENEVALERPVSSDKSFYYLLAVDAVARIRFHSDEELMSRGFRGIFRAVFTDDPPDLDLPSVCGFEKISTDELQLIQTPGYPIEYPRAIQCMWILHAPDDEKIELLIDEGETEKCCDKLFIYSGNDRVGEVSGVIKHQQRFVSPGNHLTLIFESDQFEERAGLVAHFRTLKLTTTQSTTTRAVAVGCGFEQVSSDLPQVIETPNYPEEYAPNLNCQWVIRAPGNDTFIRIHFQDMQTEQCCDHVELLDNGVVMMRGSGDVLQKMDYVTTSNLLIVRFLSDSSVQHTGFKLIYATGYGYEPQDLILTTESTKQKEETCGFDRKAGVVKQEISSPDYPLAYPMNANCTWKLRAPPGEVIQITFTHFHTEACCDYLDIIDGDVQQTRLKGKKAVTTLVSKTSTVTLNFISDNSIVNSGFLGYFLTKAALLSETTTPEQLLTTNVAAVPTVATNQRTTSETIRIPLTTQMSTTNSSTRKTSTTVRPTTTTEELIGTLTKTSKEKAILTTALTTAESLTTNSYLTKLRTTTTLNGTEFLSTTLKSENFSTPASIENLVKEAVTHPLLKTDDDVGITTTMPVSFKYSTMKPLLANKQVKCFVGTYVDFAGKIQINTQKMIKCEENFSCFSAELMVLPQFGSDIQSAVKLNHKDCTKKCEEVSCSEIIRATLQAFNESAQVTRCRLSCCNQSGCTQQSKSDVDTTNTRPGVATTFLPNEALITMISDISETTQRMTTKKSNKISSFTEPMTTEQFTFDMQTEKQSLNATNKTEKPINLTNDSLNVTTLSAITPLITTTEPASKYLNTSKASLTEIFKTTEGKISEPFNITNGQNTKISETTNKQVIDLYNKTLEPVVEPFETTTEPVVEPFETTTEPVVEPFETTTEPVVEPFDSTVKPVVEPFETTTEPVVKPFETTTEPVVEPFETTTEPVVEPFETTTKPVVEPFETTTEPVVEPFETTTKPVVEPFETTTKPVVEPFETATEPVVEPFETTTEPVVEPFETTTEPVVEPFETTTEPVVEPFETTTKPVVEPFETTTEPVVEPFETTKEPVVEPFETTTELVVEPFETTTELVVEPFDKTTKPFVEPFETTTKPVVEPFETTTKPVVEPFETTTEPVVEPFETTTELVVEPFDKTTKPVVEPFETATKPVAEPFETTTKPVVEPFYTTVKPVVEPFETTTEPVVEPFETTTELVVEPFYTTVKPVVEPFDSTVKPVVEPFDVTTKLTVLSEINKTSPVTKTEANGTAKLHITTNHLIIETIAKTNASLNEEINVTNARTTTLNPYMHVQAMNATIDDEVTQSTVPNTTLLDKVDINTTTDEEIFTNIHGTTSTPFVSESRAELVECQREKSNPDTIPFLPGCNWVETYNKIWLCVASFLNEAPFEDSLSCNLYMQHLESCMIGMIQICSTGTNPSIILRNDSFAAYTQDVKNALHYTQPFLLQPTENLICSGEDGSSLSVINLNNNFLKDETNLTDSCAFEALNEINRLQKNFENRTKSKKDFLTFCKNYMEYKEGISLQLRSCSQVVNHILPTISYFEEKLGNSVFHSMISEKLIDLIDSSFVPHCISFVVLVKENSRNMLPQPTLSSSSMSDCKAKSLDLMFLLDGSGSMSTQSFNLVLDFTRNLTSYLDLTKNKVGVMQYSHYSGSRSMEKQRYLSTEIDIGEFTNHLEFNVALRKIVPDGYTTYTAHAILKAVDYDFPKTGRYIDPCVEKVIIVVTDGYANDNDIMENIITNSGAKNFTFFAAGIDHASKRELETIVGKRFAKKRAFRTQVRTLYKFVKRLKDQLLDLLRI